MTWRTPFGNRFLVGVEAELIRESLGYVVDIAKTQYGGHIDRTDCGARLFDDLTGSQKLAILELVGRALLRKTASIPPLNAVNEAAVAALYQAIRDGIESEITDGKYMDDSTYWRRTVRAAFFECFPDDDGDVPHPDGTDRSEWHVILEMLTDRVLWDEDFTDAPRFLDATPERAEMLKELLGINEDYFTAVADDPPDSEMPRILAALEELTRT